MPDLRKFLLIVSMFLWWQHANAVNLPQASLKYWPSEVEQAPFWKTKARVLKRIQDERDIVVAVKSREALAIERTLPVGSTQKAACLAQAQSECNTITILGGGHIKAPRDYAFKMASQYEQFTKMSDNIHEARFDEKRNQLYLHTSAFGMHARMMMKVWSKKSQQNAQGEYFDEIEWENVAGVMEGMRGRMRFSKVDHQISEISLAAYYPYSRLPVPEFFIRFGLEVAIQRMAMSIRTYIEEQYQRSLRTPAVKE